MSRYYKATIVPTVSGGNIEVRVPANSATQALGIIKTLPYFKSFVSIFTIIVLETKAEIAKNTILMKQKLIVLFQKF